MSDHYSTQHQTYPSNPGDAPTYPAHSEHQHQSSAYGYDTQRPRGQGQQYAHSEPRYDTYTNHGRDYDQSPAVYHPQITETQYEYLSPSTAIAGVDHHDHDENRLGPHYEPRGRHGSNAEYYRSADSHERSQYPYSRTSSRHENHERDETDTGGGERGLAGALVGGATGYYLGHKKSHGLLGAVGGALLGNFLENKVEERRDDGHGHGHEHRPQHGRRRRHHHHHHHESRSRSRSRHSHRSTYS
ncbi:hypothetical protein BJX70DRAFT_316737 [Aspergillus crustosus]